MHMGHKKIMSIFGIIKLNNELLLSNKSLAMAWVATPY